MYGEEQPKCYEAELSLICRVNPLHQEFGKQIIVLKQNTASILNCTYIGAILTLFFVNVNLYCSYIGAKDTGVMDKEFERILGQKIREIRESRGLTQEQLSAQLQTNGCDITRSALAKIEVAQRHVYPDELRLLKQLLNVSYEELLE